MINEVENYYKFIKKLDQFFPTTISECLGNEHNIIYQVNHQCRNAITLAETNRAYTEFDDLNNLPFQVVKDLVNKDIDSYCKEESNLSINDEDKTNLCNERKEIIAKLKAKENSQSTFNTRDKYKYLNGISTEIVINCIFGDAKTQVPAYRYDIMDVKYLDYYGQDCIVESIDGKNINALYRIAQKKDVLGSQFNNVKWKKLAYTSKVWIKKYGIFFFIYKLDGFETDETKKTLFDIICNQPNTNSSIVDRFTRVKPNLLKNKYKDISVFTDKEEKLYTFKESNSNDVIAILGVNNEVSTDELYALYQYGSKHSIYSWKEICGRDDSKTSETISEQIANFERSRFSNTNNDELWKPIKEIIKNYYDSCIVGAIIDDYYPGRILKANYSRIEKTIEDYQTIHEFFSTSTPFPMNSFSISYEYPSLGNCISNEVMLATQEAEMIIDFIKRNPAFKESNKWLAGNNNVTIHAKILVESYNNQTGKFSSAIIILSTNKEFVHSIYNYREKLFEYIMNVNTTNQLRLERERTRNAINSAIAAIMSRNMSHNLGSHFLSYTQNDIENSVENEHQDTYKQSIAHVIDFIQKRMDYLAAVNSNNVYPLLPVDFKRDFYEKLVQKNTTNFYLKNIIYSEGYRFKENFDIVWNKADNYNSLLIALPGGIISIHALFNIFENFVRNSAKYQFGNTRPQNLNFRFEVDEDPNDSSYIISIFDSKKNARNRIEGNSQILLDKLNSSLYATRFLDDDYSINEDNKGLKEMILSAFWLNQNSKQLSDYLFDFEYGDKERKENILKKYSFVFVCDNEENLGIRFKVKKHFQYKEILSIEDYNKYSFDVAVIRGQNNSVNNINYAHVVRGNVLEENFKDVSPNASKEFCLATSILHSAIKNNFKDIDNYLLKIDAKVCPGDYNSIDAIECAEENKNYYFTKLIKYDDHIAEKMTYDQYEKFRNYYPYVDSTSGKNYTEKLSEHFKDSIEGGGEDLKFRNYLGKYNSLLIKEFALTRITIIDERIYNQIHWFNHSQNVGEINFLGCPEELTLKNIQVLNYFEGDNIPSNENIAKINDVLYGNKLREIKSNPSANQQIHFLSIHLGIIEKMLNQSVWVNGKLNHINRSHEITAERIQGLLRLISDAIAPNEKVHICFHSGRGALSHELERSLRGYPIIPFSTLKSSFNDSKYYLCYLFYSIKY